MQQAAQILAIIAIILAVAAGAGLGLTFRLLRRYVRNQRVVLGSRGTVDIVEHVSAIDEKMANVRVALEDLTLAARDHDVRIDTTLSRVGIVRFDAYQDLGGRQSTAVAFLNSLGDGVVITTVVSRDFARMYVKLIKDGEPDIPLAPEETEAVEQAKGVGPFTIRPRIEVGAESEGPGGLPAELASSEVVSTGLPGKRPPSERELARENRRRRRRGLPPVEEAVMASAIGWEEPATPSPDAKSLAEQFIRQHRVAREGAAPADGTTDLPARSDGEDDEL